MAIKEANDQVQMYEVQRSCPKTLFALLAYSLRKTKNESSLQTSLQKTHEHPAPHTAKMLSSTWQTKADVLPKLSPTLQIVLPEANEIQASSQEEPMQT